MDKSCYWCDEPGDHPHYTVMIYQNGKCLGRLGTKGQIVRLKIAALVLGKERADELAEELAELNPEFSMKVFTF